MERPGLGLASPELLLVADSLKFLMVSQLSELPVHSDHRNNLDLMAGRPWLDHIMAITCLPLYCGGGGTRQ